MCGVAGTGREEDGAMSLDREAIVSLRAGFPALGRKLDGWPIVFFDGPGGT